jgi:hypothetical protein
MRDRRRDSVSSVARDEPPVLSGGREGQYASGAGLRSVVVEWRIWRTPPHRRQPGDVTICKSGARAAIAASVLSRFHAAALTHALSLTAASNEWQARGGETTTFRRCGA